MDMGCGEPSLSSSLTAKTIEKRPINNINTINPILRARWNTLNSFLPANRMHGVASNKLMSAIGSNLSTDHQTARLCLNLFRLQMNVFLLQSVVKRQNIWNQVLWISIERGKRVIIKIVIRCKIDVYPRSRSLSWRGGGDPNFFAYPSIHEEILQPLNGDMGPGRTRSTGAMAAGSLIRCLDGWRRIGSWQIKRSGVKMFSVIVRK